MERRTCKLCFKSFSNGRALGGHMRSHMATLQPSPHHHPPPTPQPKIRQLGHHQRVGNDQTESASSSSSSSEEEELDKAGLLCYGLRENPKKSFRLVDPEFSFAVDAGSSVVQDRESETESSKNPPFRRRSKRNRKSTGGLITEHQHQHQHQPELKKPKKLISKLISKTEFPIEQPSEPVSSVSDTTPEEDVALCLMMLSRGSWNGYKGEEEEEENEEEAEKSIEEETDDDEEEESEEMMMMMKMNKLCTPPPSRRNRGKYQCGTCKKVFRSYQALGGHRASHKKIRGCNYNTPSSSSRTIINGHGHDFLEPHEPGGGGGNNNYNGNGNAGGGGGVTSTNGDHRKTHECPVCFRVFGSGQALGGHKRSHISGSSSATINNNNNNNNNTNSITTSNSAKFGDNLIDLNLPAPIDDDDISQIELSAVSDAEFVDPIK